MFMLVKHGLGHWFEPSWRSEIAACIPSGYLPSYIGFTGFPFLKNIPRLGSPYVLDLNFAPYSSAPSLLSGFFW